MSEPGPRRGDERLFGVYVHWPFCLSKCPYCDFNSHVREGVDQRRWRDALRAELRHYAASTAGREVTSVFFGGGTPSLMPPDTVAAVIAEIRALWPVSAGAEITLEANPTSVEAARFAALGDAGVNRVSLGVQALDDAALRFLGRGHSAAEARRAIDVARRHFGRYSFDLIYGRPDHTVPVWLGELDAALEMAGDHLSVYQLTIERGTRFWQDHARGAFAMPDDDAQAVLYEATTERLAAAGLPAYEISNHARDGGACRHNLTYWRYEDYVGVGPGAHGRLTTPSDGAVAKRATRQTSGPEAWLERVEAQGHATDEDSAISGPGLAVEALMMGLRLAEGVDRLRFRRVTGRDPVEACGADGLRSMVEGGFVAVDAASLRATPAGLQRLNAVLTRLLPD